MLDFGNLEKVEKTFTRATGSPKGQNWDGIKFRRFLSNKGSKAAREAGEEFQPFVESKFTISEKAFNELNLSENGLIEYRDKNTGKVYLILTDEENAQFMKGRKSKDGTPTNKTKDFTNTVMEGHLVDAGIISADEQKSFFLSLNKEDAEGAPSYVKGVYELAVDADGSDDSDEDQGQDSVQQEVPSEEDNF